MSTLLQNFDSAPYVLGPETVPGATLGGNQYQCDLRIHPKNPNYRSISIKTGTAETVTAVMSTINGGNNWSTTSLSSSGDSDVVYDNNGTLHWTFINKAASNLVGYRRSTDGGMTWSAVTNIGTAVDHGHVTADRTNSQYAGSVYQVGRSYSPGSILINYSRDGGLTWSPTSVPCSGTLTNLGKGFVFGPTVMKNGTVAIPVKTSNTTLTDANGYYAGATYDNYVLISTDGGQSFTVNHQGTVNNPSGAGAGGFNGLSNMGVGFIANGSERLYLTYVQQYSGAPTRLMLTTSDDRGSTWTSPRIIADALPTTWGAGSCSVMVNKNNVVGVQYFDIAPSDASIDMYFVYSKDYGATFCSPVRLSTVSSPAPSSQPRYFGQDQVFSDVDCNGNFHTVWTDARASSTNYTIYSRIVTVN